jgi:hypothetical protein
MKRYIHLFWGIIGLGILSGGCIGEKESALNDLEAFTEQLKSGTDNYTQEDWDIAYNQFEAICTELDNNEYTDDELKYIGKCKGECTAIFAKHFASDFKRSINRIGKEVEGFIEGVAEELGGNVRQN